MSSIAPAAPRPLRLAPALASLVALRTMLDAGIRAPLPYLTFIAAAFGAQAADAGWLATALSLAGLTSLLGGALESALGRRRAVIGLASLFALSCLLMALAQSLAMALALCTLLGVSRAMIMPHIQAFVGDHVPWQRRGLAIGVVELAWALGWIIGVVAFGWLIERVSWWVPFALLGVGGGISLIAALRFALTSDSPPRPLARHGAMVGFAQWGAVIAQPRAFRLLLHGALISAASQLVTLAYAPQLVQTFALTPASLGVASVVIGVAEIVAELGAAALLDRLGKWRAMALSTFGFVGALAAQVLLSDTLGGALAGLFGIFLTFEFALVASLAVSTEAVPQARAAMAGLLGTLHSGGRVAASLVALPLLFSAAWSGVLGVSAGLALIAALLVSVKGQRG